MLRHDADPPPTGAAVDTAQDTSPGNFSDARAIHRALSRNAPSDLPDETRAFLERCLDEASRLDAELPASPDGLAAWFDARVDSVGRGYRDYLAARQAGESRRLFRSRAHAQYFLKSVAPTKLVDGAWLYGLVAHWRDPRFAALIRTYLEELGEGVPDRNHVLLYRKLLAAEGCERWEDGLPDDRWLQGALQLALAHGAAHFLPEVIGYNLGYEETPLHLLITGYELNELGIDPTYFTLHVTIDNADSGHARQALDAVSDALPRVGDADDFWRRVRNGYRLNLLGPGAEAIARDYDPRREVETIFARKSAVGRHAHADYCRVAGRGINDWLSDPDAMPAFLDALQEAGWIRRGRPAADSRFWKLIDGERAEMFGVFTAFEQQAIRDWIEDGAADAANAAAPEPGFRQRQRRREAVGKGRENGGSARRRTARGIIRHPAAAPAANDFESELRALERELAAAPSREEAMTLLAGWMSPAAHHSAPGLMATRVFVEMLR
ncbi:MAG: iron-containing redox enzyme family protein [Burkholderiaceae bacterium]